MRDFVEVFACVVVPVVAFIVLILGLAYWVNEYKCNAKANTMGDKPFYSWSTGCMVQHKGQWVPLDAVRTF